MKVNKAKRKKIIAVDGTQKKISSFFKPKSSTSASIAADYLTKTPTNHASDYEINEIIPPTPIINNCPLSPEVNHQGTSKLNDSSDSIISPSQLICRSRFQSREFIIPPTPTSPTIIRSISLRDVDIISPTQRTPPRRRLLSGRRHLILSKGVSLKRSRSPANDDTRRVKGFLNFDSVPFISPTAEAVTNEYVARTVEDIVHKAYETHENSLMIAESITKLDINGFNDQVHGEVINLNDNNTELTESMVFSDYTESPEIKNCRVIEQQLRGNQAWMRSTCRYTRHLVHQTINTLDFRGRPVKELLLKPDNNDDSFRSLQSCVLKGYWADTIVNDGDIVNVLAMNLTETNAISLNDDDPNDSGLIVINPDRLVSGTTIVSTLFCQRKALLNEWYRSLDAASNVHMFIGTVVHQLFQDSMVMKLTTELDVQRHLKLLLTRPKYLLEMYKFRDSHSVGWFDKEFAIFVPMIVRWIGKHFLDESNIKENLPDDHIKIVRVNDIEENVWSPRLGVKGKMDLTVEVVEVGRQLSTKIVPLELKTGRSSFSIEHCGQVTLYSMMSEDRRPDPGCGILLYIRDGQMRQIPSDNRNRRGLIQRRNELISYLDSPLKPDILNNGRRLLGRLPKPLSDRRLCEKCPFLTTCAVRHRLDDDCDTLESSHPFQNLAATVTGHLNQADLTYFGDWCSLIFLESLASGERSANIKDIWLSAAHERERKGECFSDMILIDAPSAMNTGESRYLHEFVKSFSSTTSKNPLTQVGITSNQAVAISVESENLVALATGFVNNVTDSSVTLLLDRNLYEKSGYKQMVFRIDAYSSQSVLKTCLSNVARLMDASPEAKNIRDILVGRRQATFRPKIGKESLSKGKAILRGLNEGQKKAVLKTLMTDDYLLIKGMPGTGKTSTIVALIRLFYEMGLTVLLASHTHSAVDNVLLKLKANQVDFLRLGTYSRIHQELREHSEDYLFGQVSSLSQLDHFLNSKRVVATTFLGSNHTLFSRGRVFDYCVIDEASQVLQPVCLGPLFHSRKFILVGDHDQLPPVVQSQEARQLGFDESIFSRLYSSHSTMYLTDQYRMNSEITRLANILSYKGALKCATNDVADSVLRLPNLLTDGEESMTRNVLNTDPTKSVIFMDTDEIECRDSNEQVYNDLEVGIIVFLVGTLLKAGLEANKIGIICPFRQQVTRIIRALRRSDFSSNSQSIETNTIDQYQGREKEVILMSCVKNSKTIVSTFGEILNDRRRINVAITRARTKLILIGSRSTMLRYESMRTIIEALRTEQIVTLIQDDIDRLIN